MKMYVVRCALGLLAALVLLGCQREPERTSYTPPSVGAGGAVATEGPVLVCLGDSLTAGYGLSEDEAWVALVGAQLAARGSEWSVRNAGVSGDTTAGVLRRLDWHAGPEVKAVMLAIGGNDGLRGQPIGGIRDNIRAIVKALQARGVKVMLAGMRLPPSHGQQYSQAFAAIYPELARELDVPLLPFLLEGVGGDPTLNLPDGIHPNAEGHRRVAERVMAFLDDTKVLQ